MEREREIERVRERERGGSYKKVYVFHSPMEIIYA